MHRTLSCAFGDAVRLGDLPRNPVLNARKPNIRSVPTKAIPREHWKKMYREAMNNPFTHARIDIGLMSGLRPDENIHQFRCFRNTGQALKMGQYLHCQTNL